MTKFPLARSTPLTYLITDRRLVPHRENDPDLTFLIEFAKRALAAGVDMVQIREPGLSTRDILSVSEAVGELAPDAGARVLINDRADIAACSAAGVHLTTRSLPVEVVRGAFGVDMLVGVSTHSLEEATAAERGGADFIVFGPVFETASKKQYGKPVGLESLRRVAASLSIPVLALGGVRPSNVRESLEAGAAGVAGISMFTDAQDLRSLVAAIRNQVVT